MAALMIFLYVIVEAFANIEFNSMENLIFTGMVFIAVSIAYCGERLGNK